MFYSENEFLNIQKNSLKATLLENISLEYMGVDEDLFNKDLYVQNIDKHRGIGGLLSTVYVIIEKGKFKFLNSYLIPTKMLNFI